MSSLRLEQLGAQIALLGFDFTTLTELTFDTSVMVAQNLQTTYRVLRCV